MSQMKKFSVGPLRVTASAANYLNPPAASTGVGLTAAQYALVSMIQFESTSTATTVSFYKGATAGTTGGTEIFSPLTAIPASPAAPVVFYFNPPLRFEATDFLSGLAGTTNIVNVIIAGEVGTTG